MNVRRLLLFVEESIDRGTQWAAFEPNAAPLRDALRRSVGAFLHGLFRQGAFPGRNGQEACFVRVGPDTTTPQDIAAGIVNVVVGVAPLRPAEFVILRITQRAGPAEAPAAAPVAGTRPSDP